MVLLLKFLYQITIDHVTFSPLLLLTKFTVLHFIALIIPCWFSEGGKSIMRVILIAWTWKTFKSTLPQSHCTKFNVIVYYTTQQMTGPDMPRVWCGCLECHDALLSPQFSTRPFLLLAPKQLIWIISLLQNSSSRRVDFRRSDSCISHNSCKRSGIIFWLFT